MPTFFTTLCSFILSVLIGACGAAVAPKQNASTHEASQTATIASTEEALPATIDVDSNSKMRGMTFAHEGYDGKTGYGGETVGPSLDSLAKLNINALAIVPYTFMRQPDVPTKLPIPDRLGMETDAAVLNSVKEAKLRGWTVLMKPQIWISGHWPGDINFDTQEKWDTFFDQYRTWILHYAKLCETNDVEALCIGTEMVRTTLDHPDQWRSIIKDIREVYGGKLTYAANWGEEFEGLSFWDALDVVGLNSYYPLSRKQDPTDEELYEGAKAWMIKANNISARAQKPLWLTEVGYRSAKSAWLQPHAEAAGRDRSTECQQRCYTAMLKATDEAPMLTGMFVWKWPSYLGRGSKASDWHDRKPGLGFTPGGKEAGQELAAFYSRWE